VYFATNPGRDAATQLRDATVPDAFLQPFSDDESGSGYFRSDHHHRFVAAEVHRHLAKGSSVVLVSGTPEPDGELIARFLDEIGTKTYRASFVAGRAGMNFNDLMLAYGRQLGLGVDRTSGRLWALLSHLMLEARRGITRVLVLEHADALDALCFDELLRFTQLDAPHAMPLVLGAEPDFADPLTRPALDFVNAAITGRVAADRLAPEEVGAFIQYQLNGTGDGTPFPPDMVNLIASAADGNPAIVNALAREFIAAKAAEGAAAGAGAAAETTRASAPAEATRASTPKTAEPAAEPAPAEPAAPIATPPLAPAEPPSPPPRARRAGGRGMEVAAAAYVIASILAGGAILYALAPTPWRGPAPLPSAAVDDILPNPGKTATAVVAVPAPLPGAEPAVASAAPAPPPSAAPPGPALAANATPVVAPELPKPPPVTEPPTVAQEPAAAARATSGAERPATAASSPAPGAATAATSAPPPAMPAADRPTVAEAAPAPQPGAAALHEQSGASQGEAPAPPRPQPTSDGVSMMVERGDQLLAAGDVVSARHFYQRAAGSGNAAALCGVARSYDPEILRKIGVRGVAGDAATAVEWYRKAAEAGSLEALMRLQRLVGDLSQPKEQRR
jgi:hypothetical protein